MKMLVAVLMVSSLFANSALADTGRITSKDSPRASLASSFSSPKQYQVCCRICSKGKACGDTCIARDRTCHVGPGCACNG